MAARQNRSLDGIGCEILPHANPNAFKNYTDWAEHKQWEKWKCINAWWRWQYDGKFNIDLGLIHLFWAGIKI